ncbi:MAG: metallophosphoesterase [Tardiphaga sp.]|nr:metallophosphoesterase [Tardiphaga sp.]
MSCAEGPVDLRLHPHSRLSARRRADLLPEYGAVCFPRSTLLSSLLDFIKSDAVRRQQEPKVLFLGDLVDRGSDSKGCLDLVASTLDRWTKSKLLLGNHDDYFLRILGTDDPDPAMFDFWIRNGGLTTLTITIMKPTSAWPGPLSSSTISTMFRFSRKPLSLKSMAHSHSCTREFIRIDRSTSRNVLTV